MDEQLRVLHGRFDPDVHMRTFIHYFEAVMARNGTVIYAVPGHKEVLERLYRYSHGLRRPTKEGFAKWVLDGNFGDYTEFLMEQTGAICLWEHGVMGTPNERQSVACDGLRGLGILEA